MNSGQEGEAAAGAAAASGSVEHAQAEAEKTADTKHSAETSDIPRGTIPGQTPVRTGSGALGRAGPGGTKVTETSAPQSARDKTRSEDGGLRDWEQFGFEEIGAFADADFGVPDERTRRALSIMEASGFCIVSSRLQDTLSVLAEHLRKELKPARTFRTTQPVRASSIERFGEILRSMLTYEAGGVERSRTDAFLVIETSTDTPSSFLELTIRPARARELTALLRELHCGLVFLYTTRDQDRTPEAVARHPQAIEISWTSRVSTFIADCARTSESSAVELKGRFDRFIEQNPQLEPHAYGVFSNFQPHGLATDEELRNQIDARLSKLLEEAPLNARLSEVFEKGNPLLEIPVIVASFLPGIRHDVFHRLCATLLPEQRAPPSALPPFLFHDPAGSDANTLTGQRVQPSAIVEVRLGTSDVAPSVSAAQKESGTGDAGDEPSPTGAHKKGITLLDLWDRHSDYYLQKGRVRISRQRTVALGAEWDRETVVRELRERHPRKIEQITNGLFQPALLLNGESMESRGTGETGIKLLVALLQEDPRAEDGGWLADALARICLFEAGSPKVGEGDMEAEGVRAVRTILQENLRVAADRVVQFLTGLLQFRGEQLGRVCQAALIKLINQNSRHPWVNAVITPVCLELGRGEALTDLHPMDALRHFVNRAPLAVQQDVLMLLLEKVSEMRRAPMNRQDLIELLRPWLPTRDRERLSPTEVLALAVWEEALFGEIRWTVHAYEPERAGYSLGPIAFLNNNVRTHALISGLLMLDFRVWGKADLSCAARYRDVFWSTLNGLSGREAAWVRNLEDELAESFAISLLMRISGPHAGPGDVSGRSFELLAEYFAHATEAAAGTLGGHGHRSAEHRLDVLDLFQAALLAEWRFRTFGVSMGELPQESRLQIVGFVKDVASALGNEARCLRLARQWKVLGDTARRYCSILGPRGASSAILEFYKLKASKYEWLGRRMDITASAMYGTAPHAQDA
jgi:hypothetical protein